MENKDHIKYYKTITEKLSDTDILKIIQSHFGWKTDEGDTVKVIKDKKHFIVTYKKCEHEWDVSTELSWDIWFRCSKCNKKRHESKSY